MARAGAPSPAARPRQSTPTPECVAASRARTRSAPSARRPASDRHASTRPTAASTAPTSRRGRPAGGEHRHDPGQRNQRQRRRRRVDRPSAELEHVVGERPLACQNRGSASAAWISAAPRRRRPRSAAAQPRTLRVHASGNAGATGRSVSAVAIACSTARALFWVSFSSNAGMLSATMPAPAWT